MGIAVKTRLVFWIVKLPALSYLATYGCLAGSSVMSRRLTGIQRACGLEQRTRGQVLSEHRGTWRRTVAGTAQRPVNTTPMIWLLPITGIEVSSLPSLSTIHQTPKVHLLYLCHGYYKHDTARCTMQPLLLGGHVWCEQHVSHARSWQCMLLWSPLVPVLQPSHCLATNHPWFSERPSLCAIRQTSQQTCLVHTSLATSTGSACRRRKKDG